MLGGADPVPPNHFPHRAEENLHVQQERTVIDVPNIQRELLSQVIALRPLIWAQPVIPGFTS